VVSELSFARDVYQRELKLSKLQSILLQLSQMLMAVSRSAWINRFHFLNCSSENI